MPLGAKDPIDTHGRYSADPDSDDVEVTCLIVGIERREQDEAEETAGDCARDDFSDDEERTPRAAVAGSQMPLAAGTGRHSYAVTGRSGLTITQGRAAEVEFCAYVDRDGRSSIARPSATTASEKSCATVSGPSTRVLTRTNSSAKRNAPTPTK